MTEEGKEDFFKMQDQLLVDMPCYDGRDDPHHVPWGSEESRLRNERVIVKIILLENGENMPCQMNF